MANEIIISTSENEFRSMLIKMMGRGSILSQKINGQYIVEYDDILDLINKIAQRVHLQNHCSMSDLLAKFVFSDGSKDSIPSYESLKTYRSVNNGVCISAHISFAFLINLQSRGIEKQTVDIYFKVGADNSSEIKRFILNQSDITESYGSVEISIEYTDITWANDIKNLFEKYAFVHVKRFDSRISISSFFENRFFYTLALPISMMIMMFSALPKTDTDKIDNLISNMKLDRLAILEKIDKKIDIIIYKSNTFFSFYDILKPTLLVIFMLVSFFVFVRIIKSIPTSGILLSSESKKIYCRREKSRLRTIALTISGLILSISISVVSSNIDRIMQSALN